MPVKHEHVRVGSGILICPYAIVNNKEGPAKIRHICGSAPSWLSGESPQVESGGMRNCCSPAFKERLQEQALQMAERGDSRSSLRMTTKPR